MSNSDLVGCFGWGQVGLDQVSLVQTGRVGTVKVISGHFGPCRFRLPKNDAQPEMTHARTL